MNYVPPTPHRPLHTHTAPTHMRMCQGFILPPRPLQHLIYTQINMYLDPIAGTYILICIYLKVTNKSVRAGYIVLICIICYDIECICDYNK